MTMTTNNNYSTGVYIHIPFCIKKCNYCAFLSEGICENSKYEKEPMESFVAEGDCTELWNRKIQRYVNSLIKEIEIRGKGEIVNSVFFGGGTPSILSASQVNSVIEAVKNNFSLEKGCEITLEANPATLSFEKLRGYREAGVNRLSLGVQSTRDSTLKYLGRIHSAEQAAGDVRLARKAGFDNINLDLIFAVPGTGIPDVMKDLENITALEPEHISFYSLQLEEGTPFFRAFEEGKLHEVPDDIDRQMYHRGCEFLKERGYIHYEISNFARPGRESRHNLKYWSMEPYYGLGLGASSFLPVFSDEGKIPARHRSLSGEAPGNGGHEKDFFYRSTNVSDLDEYCKNIENDTYKPGEIHRNNEKDSISEGIFTGLRRMEGVTWQEIYRLSEDFHETQNCSDAVAEQWFRKYYDGQMGELEDFAAGGFVIVDSRGMRLTQKGIDISNKIMALFV